MFWHIKIFSSLLCLLLLHQNVNTKECPPGQKPNYNTNICENCSANQYRTSGVYCRRCSTCQQGSEEVSKCAPTSDTRCRCKPGFTPKDKEKEVLCVCEIGSGTDNAGNTCTKCRHGFYTDKEDTKCRKWRECKSGIKYPGNSTSDVACKEKEEKEVTVEAGPTFKTTSKPPPQIPMTTSYIVSLLTKVPPSKSGDRSFSLWLVMLCGGILLLMGLLYYKCKSTRCIDNKIKVDSRKDSTCRKPVEESGEKCLSLLV